MFHLTGRLDCLCYLEQILNLNLKEEQDLHPVVLDHQRVVDLDPDLSLETDPEQADLVTDLDLVAGAGIGEAAEDLAGVGLVAVLGSEVVEVKIEVAETGSAAKC